MIEFGTIRDFSDVVIAICWFIFVIVWMVSAFFVKRTVERSLGWARLLVLVAVLLIFTPLNHVAALRQPLWTRTAAIGAVAALITIGGLAFCVWARTVLGSNWSGSITFKQGHELIQRGPYAFVRHPIYSGLLLMGLGSAINSGRPRSFLFLATVLVALAIKAHFEEEVMTRHFPEVYPEYRRRVKALIPGVW
jgi:protein-S-isoprenylcysteine O-methyltransferase Ste14